MATKNGPIRRNAARLWGALNHASTLDWIRPAVVAVLTAGWGVIVASPALTVILCAVAGSTLTAVVGAFYKRRRATKAVPSGAEPTASPSATSSTRDPGTGYREFRNMLALMRQNAGFGWSNDHDGGPVLREWEAEAARAIGSPRARDLFLQVRRIGIIECPRPLHDLEQSLRPVDVDPGYVPGRISINGAFGSQPDEPVAAVTVRPMHRTRSPRVGERVADTRDGPVCYRVIKDPDSVIDPPSSVEEWVTSVTARLDEFCDDAYVLCDASRASTVMWAECWTEFSKFVLRHLSIERAFEMNAVGAKKDEAGKSDPYVSNVRFARAVQLVDGWLDRGLTRFDLANDDQHRCRN